ncbi:P63C domain-containing protein [Pseudomonas sp. KSR10]|uniref:P63C domain-containing protein n=1 Tax=Pseudomonas sp. KSR10 TaxID=2916654 RepID=UPI001EF965A6|nr:P63C domain-containing protein [Pseudomonas sp. KSR10]MCG6540169.1 P63C domain-containing protein [Pseudomonas sp. KSR10]
MPEEANKKPTGRAKGGAARQASQTPAQRSENARKAALAKADIAKLPRATHGSADHPLKIGDIEIPCYVLDDGTRVISQRGMLSGLDMKYGTRAGGADRLTNFARGKGISPFINNDLMLLIENPIKFTHSGGGGVAFGYPATLLADLCDAILAARKNGSIQKQQEHIAAQAEILVRGFARVGIIALVDEATGYQKDRAKDALAQILEAFVAKELQPYVRAFPADYYEELFRLRGLKYPPENPKFRPQYFGLLTNDIVYERLAPGLLEELKKQAAKDEKKKHLHRRLTQEVGHPRLREHLASVVTAMKLSNDYPDFISKLNRIHPRFGDNQILDLEEGDR